MMLSVLQSVVWNLFLGGQQRNQFILLYEMSQPLRRSVSSQLVILIERSEIHRSEKVISMKTSEWPYLVRGTTQPALASKLL